MESKGNGRRRFLKQGAALAGLAVGAGAMAAKAQTLGSKAPDVSPTDWHAYGERSRFINSTRETEVGNRTPIQDQMGIITPSSLHFVNTHGQEPQRDIDPAQHRLLIHGLVDRPLIFTMEELKGLPSVSRVHIIECGSNGSPTEAPGKTVQERWGYSACSEWTGVLLSLLLEEAGVKKGASWIVAEGLGVYKLSLTIPLEKAMQDVLVAYGQNGEPVRPENGFPLRLVTPGYEGVNNVKWLRRIKVTDEAAMTKMETRQHTSTRRDGKARWFQFEMGPKSVITFPSGEQRLSQRGFYQIRGFAWSGSGYVRRVEVSTDGGRSWQDAQIQEPVHRVAYTLFRLPWTWNGGEAVLMSRCTDEHGVVQPTLAELQKKWGVSSEHWLTTTSSVLRFNAIQPWRVTPEGTVQEALFEGRVVHRHKRPGWKL